MHGPFSSSLKLLVICGFAASPYGANLRRALCGSAAVRSSSSRSACTCVAWMGSTGIHGIHRHRDSSSTRALGGDSIEIQSLLPMTDPCMVMYGNVW